MNVIPLALPDIEPSVKPISNLPGITGIFTSLVLSIFITSFSNVADNPLVIFVPHILTPIPSPIGINLASLTIPVLVVLNVERTSGVNIPVIPGRLEMGFTEGSMSGSAKGITFILPKKAVGDGGVRFIRPQAIQKTSWATTFPKAQVERAIEKMSAVPKPSGNVLKPTAVASTLLRTGQAPIQGVITPFPNYSFRTPSQDFDIEFLDYRKPLGIESNKLTTSVRTIVIPKSVFSLSSALRENQLQVGSPRTISIVSTTPTQN